jgi:hypothetical protein
MCRMTAIKKLLPIFVVLAWLQCAGQARAQDSATAVRVKLSLADGKTVYRMGDPVKLILEFTADTPGYQVDTMIDGSGSDSDRISVAPDAGGVYHWFDEYTNGQQYLRDVISLAKLSTTPTRIELLLNDSLRFDKPGKYSVRVTTRRVSQTSPSNGYSPPFALTTNEVSFEVRPMSVAEEELEVRRLSDLLDTQRGWQAEEKLTRELSYLTGDVSSREKVRRFLNAEGHSGNYTQHITYGLFIARNRPLVLQLLETAMRDSATPVTEALLNAAARLRLLQNGGGTSGKQAATVEGYSFMSVDPKFEEIRNAYLSELAAGLGRRSGKSQSTTAMTILTHLPKGPLAESATLSEVRRILLQQFDSLHPFDQEYLMRVYWEQLRDPSLVPSLKKMLGYTAVASKNIHDAALKRLIEIAPEEARAYVIAEIRDPSSLVEPEILGGLSDKSLPEVDAALLEQIRRYAASKGNFDAVYLKQKAELAVRYATQGIYGELMQIYQSSAARLSPDARAALLAYFARYNEPEALPLIRQALREFQQGQDFTFLTGLTRLYYSDALDALLLELLESDEPQTASTAAYFLSLHGAAGDVKMIEARLERWRKEWGHRAEEADANLQGTVERELIMALTRAEAAWKLAPERVKELQQSCVTNLCRQSFRTP